MNRIKKLMVNWGLNQREFANEIGISEVTVSRYVNKDVTPRPSIARAMAKYFGVSVEYLLGHSDRML